MITVMSQITVLTTAATFISQSAHSSVFITRCTKQTRKDLPHFSHICLFISVGFLSLQSIFLPPIQPIFSIDFSQFSPIVQLTSPNSVHFFNWLPPIQSICSIDFPQFSPFFLWTSILSFLHRSLFCGNVSHFAASLCHSLSLFLYFTHCFLSQFSLFLQIHRKKSQTAVMSHFLNSHWLKIQRLGR